MRLIDCFKFGRRFMINSPWVESFSWVRNGQIILKLKFFEVDSEGKNISRALMTTFSVEKILEIMTENLGEAEMLRQLHLDGNRRAE